MGPQEAGMVSGICIGGFGIFVLSIWACYKGSKRLKNARKDQEEPGLPRQVHLDLPVRIE